MVGYTPPLGQNFINDQNFIASLLKDLPINGRHILEAGPGKGVMSSMLLERCASLTSVELDKDLFSSLENRFGGKKNFNLVHGDFLEFEIPELPEGEKYLFVANIPYYISTPIITKLISERSKFDGFHMMLQFEYGRRLISDPGNKSYGSLSVYFTNNFSMDRFVKVPKTVFTPVPAVDSCFISFHNDLKYDLPEEFQRFMKATFSRRRKKIPNSLLAYFNNMSKNDIISRLREKEIDCDKRPEDFDLASFVLIFNLLSAS